MKRNSKNQEFFRDKSFGARLDRIGFELALEQPVEGILICVLILSRFGRSLTVIEGGYNITW